MFDFLLVLLHCINCFNLIVCPSCEVVIVCPCHGRGRRRGGKERLSAAVLLETKRNVASSIYLDFT